MTPRTGSDSPIDVFPSFRSLLAASADTLAVLDPAGTIRWVNDEWRRFAAENGARPSAVGPGICYLDVCDAGADSLSLRDGLRSVLESRRERFEYQYPCHSPDARRWFEMICVSVPDAPGWALVSHRDVTHRVLLELEVRHAADHDPLTGLANRRLLRRHASAATESADRSGKEMAVFCIDLDRFKELNDTLGHEAGDRVLETVANRLRVACRDDDLVARLGGDEFVVVAQEIDRKESRDLCRRIRIGIEDPVDLSRGPVRLHASVGFALYPTHGDSFQAVLREADEAMYADKLRRQEHLTTVPSTGGGPTSRSLLAEVAS